MRIDISKYRQDHPVLVDRTTFPYQGDQHDGLILYHPKTEEWVAVTSDGEVVGFGEGDAQTNYDDMRHWRLIEWIKDYQREE